MDRTTFDHLVVAHLAAAQRFAIRLAGDPDAGEEIVQDALLRAARGWRTFRGDSRFQTWFFRVILNAFRDHRSAQRSAERLPDEIIDDRAGDPVSSASMREQQELIARMVSTLPARQREVMVLHVYDQLTIADVAATVGISEQNARTHLALARRNLRQRLGSALERPKP